MNKMIKFAAVAVIAACSMAAFCQPRPGHPPARRPNRVPVVHTAPPRHGHHHHHHHNSGWGHGGHNFWPGFTGGLVGSIIQSTAAPPLPAPVIVQPQPQVMVQPAPVIVPQSAIIVPR